MDNAPNEGLVMVIQHDKTAPIPLSTRNGEDDVIVNFYIDKNGFPVYITNKKHAGMLCTVQPNRYRLYRSVSLTVPVTKSNGARVWEAISPWHYDAKKVQVGNDKDNDEAIYETRIDWHEDVEEKFVVTASKEFITGKAEAPKAESSVSNVTEESKLKALRERNEKLEEKIVSLEGDKSDLKSVISQQNKELASLYEEVKALKSPPEPASVPEKEEAKVEDKPASKKLSGLDGRYPKKK